MSILLSAYYPEGIVFVADKNVTITVGAPSSKKYVEPTLTKVLSWPWQRAVVGFVGLATLAGYRMDEWLRVFIAGTRDSFEIDKLAHELRGQVERDFQHEFSSTPDVTEKRMIIHLGGFAVKSGIPVPVMYHIRNVPSMDIRTGAYSPAERNFLISEDVERDIGAEDYPTRVRSKLQDMVDQGQYLWYNNGANKGAFNIFKEYTWRSLRKIQDAGFAPRFTGLGARGAYCMMAVEVFEAYFTHHFTPEDRVVGGGVDICTIPWPT